MILDAIFMMLLFFAAFRGWQKGILWAVFSVLALIVALFVSLKLSHYLAQILFQKQLLTGSYTLLISFILLFATSILLIRLVVKWIEKILDKIALGWINRLSGALLYMGIAAMVISTLLWLGSNSKLLGPDVSSQSRTYAYLAPIAPGTIEFVSTYTPLLGDLYSDVEELLHSMNEGLDKKLKDWEKTDQQ